MAWAAVGAAAVTVVGSSLLSKGAGQAQGAQNAMSEAAIAEQRRQYDQTRADNAPFLASGTAANTRLRSLMGLGDDTSAAGFGSLNNKFGIADFNADPVTQLGYQSGLDLGTRGINAKAAANGGRDNGAVLKQLTRFGTDYTNSQADASRNRFLGDQNNIYNRLAGISGTGQTAVNTSANAGATSAGNISGLLSAQGNANGAASIARGNAWQGGLQNIVGNFQQQNTLDKILAAQNRNTNSSGYVSPSSYLSFNGGDYGQNF
jgi:hypothetical protein